MSGLIWITGIVLVCWYWYSSVGVKEFAMQAVKNYCDRMEVQMLDDCIALHRLWFKRDSGGRMCFWRAFEFEFASTGNERYRGRIILLGRRVLSIELDPYRVDPDGQG